MSSLILLALIVSPLWGEVPAERVTIAEMSPATERAIEKGLVFIKHKQKADGSWGDRYFVANTAVALMALMVPGNVPGEGLYADNMDKGIVYLIKAARKHDGYFADSSSKTFYQHSLATMALSEAWGQSKRHEIGPVLKRAVDILMRAQCRDGGWRYDPRPTTTSDLSCTAMAVQALASAKEAGILVPDHVIYRAVRCVRGYQNEKTGYFGYTIGSSGEPSLYRTGSGPLCLFMLGDRRSSYLQRGLAVMMKYPEERFDMGESHFFLAHYYATQSSYQAGNKMFNYWYPRISRVLLKRQRPDGGWPSGVSPSFSTSLAILILAVPYRYLPIYQR
ncbi:MAG: terpene cyclase/mutase family protein [Planctomycetota bacterium]|jgi:hypothetical protein|nr:terpene cyclase/mutase family protein [Planctomycetota bacterium]MDP7133163.1 terpene cyclase/mutase family protein [Planctomycetota bacterium]MDP7251579.1 terpene cyclase/mutase family protein [Planctomycetota bacterium]